MKNKWPCSSGLQANEIKKLACKRLVEKKEGIFDFSTGGISLVKEKRGGNLENETNKMFVIATHIVGTPCFAVVLGKTWWGGRRDAPLLGAAAPFSILYHEIYWHLSL